MDQLVGLIDHIDKTRGTIVSDPKEADAFAWAAIKPGEKLTQIGFKHPVLPDDGVKIKITYTGVCQSDCSILSNKYGDIFPSVWPCVCGHEIVGKVLQSGKDVKGLKEGDVVGIGPNRYCCNNCSTCKAGNTNLCLAHSWKLTAGSYFGGFATEIQLPSSYVLKLPDGLDEKLAPSLMCAGGTVYAPLKRYFKEGAKAGIIGIGGLGHLALMMASKMGYRTYAISTSDSKKQLALSFGAHEFVVSKDPEQMKKFYNEEIDMILNTGPSPDVMPYIRGLKKGSGVFVQVAGPDGGNLNLSIAEFIMNQYTFAGSAAFNITDGKEMLEFCAKHKIYPKCEFFEWDKFNDAVDKCANGKVEFRSVVDVSTFKK